MPVAKIAEVSFTSADRVRDVIHNADVFDSLYPKAKAAGPRHSPPERREAKKIAKSSRSSTACRARP
ncbi:hypothetical protein SLV14_001502 [Streptomyces sp. Je 1-4]|nr:MULTISPECIES: hypothetical protein [unclassified Streptomyces]UYB45104.1 hypothetical protein SLV14_001502 [Streptomyces sp. Je 1-4]UZQ35070.1 hypothetical protein SLV14N_001502 [Streptomyces sp. Je 1-4] [Streptomyces sp. Je 1-4 4N24]UZQ42488.1 hypothetical protein SLV14NA_001502 [Streptomyces sp. Je 1-4] [Streptomyces sp. Je 1-4 4N24_ara]